MEHGVQILYLKLVLAKKVYRGITPSCVGLYVVLGFLSVVRACSRMSCGELLCVFLRKFCDPFSLY